jgi:hypothetical protein
MHASRRFHWQGDRLATAMISCVAEFIEGLVRPGGDEYRPTGLQAGSFGLDCAGRVLAD